MRFKVFYTSQTYIDIEPTKYVEIEAESITEAKNMVVREARKARVVEASDKFKSDWLNYSSKGYWIRPLALGTHGFSAGVCLQKVENVSENMIDIIRNTYPLNSEVKHKTHGIGIVRGHKEDALYIAGSIKTWDISDLI